MSGEGRVKSGCSREDVLISLWYCFHAHLLLFIVHGGYDAFW